MKRLSGWGSVAIGSVMMLVSASATASGQQAETPRSNTEKLMLSLGLGGASLYSEDLQDETHSGGGFSAQLGWGFNRLFTLLTAANGAVMDQGDDEFVLVHFDLLGRFSFAGPRRAWVPYVEGGLTARVAGQDNSVVIGDGGPQNVDLEISGGGFTIGGGVDYHFIPALALGANIRWTSGEFSTVKFNNVSIDGFELDATSTRFNIGLTWRPMRQRR